MLYSQQIVFSNIYNDFYKFANSIQYNIIFIFTGNSQCISIGIIDRCMSSAEVRFSQYIVFYFACTKN